jgi:hypothetical protein
MRRSKKKKEKTGKEREETKINRRGKMKRYPGVLSGDFYSLRLWLEKGPMYRIHHFSI